MEAEVMQISCFSNFLTQITVSFSASSAIHLSLRQAYAHRTGKKTHWFGENRKLSQFHYKNNVFFKISYQDIQLRPFLNLLIHAHQNSQIL